MEHASEDLEEVSAVAADSVREGAVAADSVVAEDDGEDEVSPGTRTGVHWRALLSFVRSARH